MTVCDLLATTWGLGSWLCLLPSLWSELQSMWHLFCGLFYNGFSIYV